MIELTEANKKFIKHAKSFRSRANESIVDGYRDIFKEVYWWNDLTEHHTRYDYLTCLFYQLFEAFRLIESPDREKDAELKDIILATAMPTPFNRNPDPMERLIEALDSAIALTRVINEDDTRRFTMDLQEAV